MFKKIWFQLHWFLGITAGTVLVVIGLSGAVYAFHEELLDLWNPGTAWVDTRGAPALPPQALADAARASSDGRPVQRITLQADPGRAAEVVFAPPPGQRRGDTVRLDPATGARLPERHGEDFFEWVERLHRWLLLPREDGRVVTGVLAGCLLFLSLSGLYLRWPRRPLASWRTWLTFDPALKGRSFLWGLHSVAGTWALVAYVVFTLTGLYWAFDGIRAPVDRWAGAAPRMAAPVRSAAMRERPAAPAPAPDLGPAWAAFLRTTGGDWQRVQLRLPERAGQPVQFSWLGSDAAHERARNRLNVATDGTVVLDERFAALPAGRRALGAIYPLHMGTYFGLPGRIAMTAAALALPLFAVTGWMLYLDRRRKARAVRRARDALATAGGGAPALSGAGGEPWLVAYASQAGRAERLAIRTAAALQAAGRPAVLAPVSRLDAEQLRHVRQVLFVASTFGDGDPPDAARRFARDLAQATAGALPQLRYGLLALGDRQYAAFCGFGHALAHQLQRLGAQPLFPPVELDGEDPADWGAWQSALAAQAGAVWDEGAGAVDAGAATDAADTAGAFGSWCLARRAHCNPGSLGAPLFDLVLKPPAGRSVDWRAGALAEILPRQALEAVAAVLQRLAFDGATPVRWQGRTRPLADALAASVLPLPGDQAADASPQAVADRLVPLAPRRYSVASVPEEGALRLLVRQARHDAGLGLASGWLTVHAPLGGPVDLRLVDNPAFAPVAGGTPAIFIGNGSGYAGLRGHLSARIRAGQRRHWLLYGERQRAHDAFCEREAAGWHAAGALERLDVAYSRDQPTRHYVQDTLRAEAERLCRWIDDGAVLFVCGSLHGMAAGVDAALADILGAAAVDDLIAAGRYRRDVY
ncbi:sulfite reductase flavoprotein subunit alpha [uncultured Xylophilus sp.]|uniref:sulfite reductase flavoprotein subunit alpha n=1 Tax=uncultured Xylophilus sp. TaxID=296832 RepID=UPI0025CC7E55|nr:sulfite reductase flavoprotein subunit alpha [uncultured Xylophilus sp.]